MRFVKSFKFNLGMGYKFKLFICYKNFKYEINIIIGLWLAEIMGIGEK